MAEQDTTGKLQEMPFWDHIDALRSVLIKMVAVLVVTALALFCVMPYIFDSVILAPCHGDFVLYQLFARITRFLPFVPDFVTDGFEVRLINIKLASQFFIHMSTSLWLALVLCFPVLLYLLWTFVRPALYPNEIHGVELAFGLGLAMFYMGLAVGYYIVFPVTLRFLAGYHVSMMVPNQISLDSYIDTFLMLIFVMGIVFEMPLLAWALGKMGILHREFFKEYRRHAVVALLILAAVITPTGDPFTLAIVFMPIYVLYELSAVLVKPTPKENEKVDASGDKN